MLLLNLILLISVTFSTPTPGYISHLLTAVPWRRILAQPGYASPGTSHSRASSRFVSKGCNAMPSALTRSIANHISTFAHSAKRSRKQLCHRGLTLVIMLALAAVLPAAQAQTLTVLHSFTQVKDGGFPSGTLVNDRAGNLYGTTQFGGRGFH